MFLRLVGTFLVSVLFLTSCMNSDQFLTIISHDRSIELQIEVVKTEEEKRIGLMGRESLSDNAGMLFVYDDGVNPVMWMKNMLIPLDIIFIQEDLTIGYIARRVQPCEAELDSQCERYGSSEKSAFVLEIPAGYVDRHGISLEDKIIMPSGI